MFGDSNNVIPMFVGKNLRAILFYRDDPQEKVLGQTKIKKTSSSAKIFT